MRRKVLGSPHLTSLRALGATQLEGRLHTENLKQVHIKCCDHTLGQVSQVSASGTLECL
jgi:hypothetical protein